MSNQGDNGLTRRQVIVGGAAAAAAIGGVVAATGTRGDESTKAPTARMPVAYLPHGGGPWPWVDLGFDKQGDLDLRAYLESVSALPATPPKALLVISAHWEQAVPTVMTAARPPMLYDYYGFPPESYEIQWPAPGAPAVASRVQELLRVAGIASAADPQRGFDHGTFVPLKLVYPDATIPTVQLSLVAGLDPAEHIAIGRALAPLRDEGVFIVGSGMSYHNMRGFRDPKARPISEEFDAWLRAAATAPAAQREKMLASWASAPSARAAHPREEHLLPLMVIAGAAGEDAGVVAYNGKYAGLRLSAYHYG
ncbi:MAG: dioxygenase [Deltaproteobacteria bacterium]|nr:dioxygenase [Deltaproteobacteria bacterium]